VLFLTVNFIGSYYLVLRDTKKIAVKPIRYRKKALETFKDNKNKL